MPDGADDISRRCAAGRLPTCARAPARYTMCWTSWTPVAVQCARGLRA